MGPVTQWWRDDGSLGWGVLSREHADSAADIALSGTQWLPRNNASRVCAPKCRCPWGAGSPCKDQVGCASPQSSDCLERDPESDRKKAAPAQLWPPSAQGPQWHAPGTFGAPPSFLPVEVLVGEGAGPQRRG